MSQSDDHLQTCTHQVLVKTLILCIMYHHRHH